MLDTILTCKPFFFLNKNFFRVDHRFIHFFLNKYIEVTHSKTINIFSLLVKEI